jgi:hypothetical protein
MPSLKERIAANLQAKMLVDSARENILSVGSSIVSDGGVYVSPEARQHAEQVFTIGQDRLRKMDVNTLSC